MYEGLYTLEGHAEDAQGLHIAKSFLVCDHARILLDPVFCCKTASQGGRNVLPHFYFCFYLISFFSFFLMQRNFKICIVGWRYFSKFPQHVLGRRAVLWWICNMQARIYACMYCVCVFIAVCMHLWIYTLRVFIFNVYLGHVYKGELSHKTHFILHCGKNMYLE